MYCTIRYVRSPRFAIVHQRYWYVNLTSRDGEPPTYRQTPVFITLLRTMQKNPALPVLHLQFSLGLGRYVSVHFPHASFTGPFVSPEMVVEQKIKLIAAGNCTALSRGLDTVIPCVLSIQSTT